ncbi:MAG: hypothetical protein KAT46_00120 [Deltaproteobacteria bacterium]|nr:hypothetical protein [Deltaproteobacteria bacterium]
MSGCGSGCDDGSGGPMSTGKELVMFVMQAHGGGVAGTDIPNGPLDTKCQGCGEEFQMKTFVDKCPKCGGIHAISPPQAHDSANIQFAGEDFKG